MPSAAAFSTTYFEGTGVLAKDPARFRANNPLAVLTRQLRDGMSAANAQAYVASRRDYVKQLNHGDARARALGTTTFLSDFAAITTP
jgi:hypothetical protein